MRTVLKKIERKLQKWRLHPIRVFVVHNVTETYSTMLGPKEDWMSVTDFRHSIKQLQKNYIFVSPEDAMRHLKSDLVRTRSYAVLTADDGYQSVYEQLPWLIENEVPIALLINPKYLDGKSYSAHLWEYVHAQHPEITEEEFVKGRYMTGDELAAITSPLVTIGSHGYEHTDNGKMSEEEFRAYMGKTLKEIENYHTFAPYHAYPWGKYSETSDMVLKEKGIIPLRADGWYNVEDSNQLHREYLPKI